MWRFAKSRTLNMNTYLKRLIHVGALTWLASAMPCLAVNEKSDGWPWNLKLGGFHDAELAEALGTGWFMNVGPTGIRAQITHEHPEYLTVRYVFKKSPAAGLIQINDVIVGANGTKMTVAHTFGRGSRGRATWEGPMLGMSKLIEDSQGKDGKLELIVWPGGKKENEKVVTVQIEAIGRFSPTWPYNCPRSDKLMIDLCDFLVQEYKRDGKFEKNVHTHSSAVLALMASGNKKYDSLLKDIMSGYVSKRYDSTNGTGFPAWGQVHDAIVMGEYYLLTKDSKLKPAMESLADCLNDSVWPETGGLSHRPFAAIQRRMAEGGPKGYGAMALPAGLGMVGLSLFKEAGLPYAEPSYQRIHEAFLCSVAPNGAIDYGFNTWDHAVIVLEDPKGAPKNSPRGIGFECLEGMTGIGKYTIQWPTKADPRYKPTDWTDQEAKTNRVFDMGGNKRLVVRNMSPEEPTKAYKQNGAMCDHIARSGAGALAHKIGNADNKSWGYLGDLMASGTAKSGKAILDGHASTHMHVLWGSLGAAMAEEKEFREYLEDMKWWMIMAQTHDGGLVLMPGRDYASTDHVYGSRNFPTACAALILSVKEKKLRITGAGSSTSSSSTSSRGSTSNKVATVVPKGRPARGLSEEKIKTLNEELITALAELSHQGQLKPLPIELSKAAAKVQFTGVEKDGKLTFKALKSESKASFAFSDLTLADHTILARLVAELRPTEAEAQSLAGVYLELSKDTPTADRYYEKAGADFKETINTLFE
jgi:hypothetical protein